MNITDTVQAKVLIRMRRLGSGKVHTSKDFLDLGSRAAVDQVLSRLVERGTIKRLGRGLYYIPRFNQSLGIESAPDIDEVARTLARQTGSRVVPSGAVAANRLGLSTQVPAKPVYLTDGRTRTVRVGNVAVVLKHAPPKDLPLGNPESALVFQGLLYMGKDAMGADMIASLRRTLSAGKRRQLLKDARYVTDWIADVVRKVCGAASVPKARHG
ncbi:MAG: type IV toxin-antitoxin system AbiEi family antitoxin domain-containing protein [Elusimicrobia bacterium]|nr:type IV toxin-antitoxin system AbiEi family antitoxin domain-containing protein [Elusimicrobiota bacterium]